MASIDRHQLWRSAGLGALGFGLGLGLAGFIGQALTYQIHDFDTGRVFGSVLYAGAGALGGAALAWAGADRRRLPWLAAAAALGLGFGLFVSATIISGWIDEHVQGLLIWAIVDSVQWAWIGVLTGALLGLAQRDRRRTGWLMLGGLVGFGVLYWPLQAGAAWLLDPVWRSLAAANSTTELPMFNLPGAAYGFVMGALQGALAGACLGLANRAAPRPTRAAAMPLNDLEVSL